MIGYVITNGNAGDGLKSTLRSNGIILVFRSEKAASEFTNSLEVNGGLDVGDLWTQKVSIEPIYEDD